MRVEEPDQKHTRAQPGGRWRGALLALLLLAGAVFIGSAPAAPTANIAATVHNLSRTGPGTNKADTETQMCVFCHTPHAAEASAPVQLWNRNANTRTYTRYTSSSLDADTIAGGFNSQPGGSSLLCLSCHDGTVALGNVRVLNGQNAAPIWIAGSPTTTMPAGAGTSTGFTRNLGGPSGSDLTNDHPISITFNDALAQLDRELARLTHPAQRDVDSGGNLIGVRTPGYKPMLPLEATGSGGSGQVQCATCHDPHITTQKFLRLNRMQAAAPAGTFNAETDQICLACHRKLLATWSQSAHASPTVANEAYTTAAATQRGFTQGTQVWQAGCLNCHDTHTVNGARWLLREATDSLATPKSGGSSAIEQACYQCHSPGGTSALTLPALSATNGVPDIRTEFGRAVRMPIATADQGGGGATSETHASADSDLVESQANLGRNAPDKRHVECTDCHNPHRVMRNSLFNGLGDSTRRTHVPSASAGTYIGGRAGNIASGVLRGTWGVEPEYSVSVSGIGSSVTGTKWPENPTFTVKKGDAGASVERSSSHLTREYQLCFKCHSTYANGDVAASFPALGRPGGTVPGTSANQMTRYTNVAAEFAVRATDPPTSGTDQGEASNAGSKCGGGDCAPVGSYPRGLQSGNGEINHRSWHPVVFPTGRDRAERSMGSGAINMRPPWDTNLGSQTMQCSDCHGHSASYTQNVGPDLTQTQGPHGSDKPFLLKGDWNLTVRLPSPASTSLCGKCHNPGANGSASGFGGDHVPDDKMGGEPCMYCHIAVPHGWKNKAFLANLRCVGTEVAGSSGDCVNRGSGTYGSTTIAPYYISTRLRISTWARSGGWGSSNCGGGTMEDNCPRTGD